MSNTIKGPSNLGPCLMLENVLPYTEIPDYQNIGVQEVFKNKKMLLAFDTGTGKTFTYSAIVRGLINANPEKKHLLIIINDSIVQVPEDIGRLVNVNVLALDGTEASIETLYKKWYYNTIICLTLESMRQMDVVHFIFQHILEVESLVIDEAHHCSHWHKSDTAFMVRSLAKWVPYVVELTATPVTSESKQYYRLMNIIDRNISMHKDQTYLGRYVNRYMYVNRSDYEIKGNYKPTLIVVEPTIDQMKKHKGIVFKYLKGEGAIPQAEALLKAVQERLADNKNIIIYVHYHNSRTWIESYFEHYNIPYTSVHGKIVKRSEKQERLDKFRNGEVNVLITSVTESLNIDADVVIFYEFTTSVKQVIGRAHRGLNPKELEIVFLITRDTDEVDFFMEYIYNRSLTIQKLLHKDYSEFIEIGLQLKALDEASETVSTLAFEDYYEDEEDD